MTSNAELQFQTLIDAVTEYAIFMLDVNGYVTNWNSGAQRIKGYSADQIIGKHFSVFYPSDSIAANEPERGLSIALSTGKFEGEGWRIRNDGSRFFANVIITPARNASHDLIGFAKVTRDISAQSEIERERLRLLDILEQSTDFIGTSDLNGNLKYHNRAARRIIGLPDDADLSSMKIPDMHPQWAADRVLSEGIPHALNAGHWHGETALLHRDGHTIPVSQILLLHKNSCGDPDFLSTIMRDISAQKKQQAQVQEILTLQRAIFDWTNYAIISTKTDGIVTQFNRSAERMLGYSASEIVGKVTPEIWHDRSEIISRAEKLSRELGRPVKPGFEVFVARATEGIADENEWTFIRKDGTRFPVTLSATALFDESRQITGFVGFIADIQRRKELDMQLRESEQRFRLAVEHSAIGMSLVGLDGRWLKVNRAICNIVGYSAEELMARTFQDITHPDDLEKDLGHVRELLAGDGDHYEIEKRYIHKNGGIVWVLLTVSLVKDEHEGPLYFVCQIQDITEAKRASDRLLKSLSEKEALLKEVHHRVKNNLQVVQSLMHLQCYQTTDPVALAVLRESQARVQSMSLIHEKLYQHGVKPFVDMPEYLGSLVVMLVQSYSRNNKITIEQCIDPTNVSIDAAMPLGLIANELITNSLKYAFPDNRTGKLRIEIGTTGSERSIRFRISDDGVGFPANVNFANSKTLGLNLIGMLTKQLRGKGVWQTEHGVSYTLTFEDIQKP